MARRRMFSLDVVERDDFIDLSIEAQALYFQMGMRADDDGFVDCMKKIFRLTAIKTDALQELIDAGLVLDFPDGVYCMADWTLNNLIKSDRYHATNHISDFEALTIKDGRYVRQSTSSVAQNGTTLYPSQSQIDSSLETARIQSRASLESEASINKTSIDKASKKKSKVASPKKSKIPKKNENLPNIPEALKEPLRHFMEQRAKNKSPMTDYAVMLLLRKLEKLAPRDISKQVELLNTATERGWKSVYPPKQADTAVHRYPDSRFTEPTTSETISEVKKYENDFSAYL